MEESTDNELQQIIDAYNPFAVYEYPEDRDSEFLLVLRAEKELEKRRLVSYINSLK